MPCQYACSESVLDCGVCWWVMPATPGIKTGAGCGVCWGLKGSGRGCEGVRGGGASTGLPAGSGLGARAGALGCEGGSGVGTPGAQQAQDLLPCRTINVQREYLSSPCGLGAESSASRKKKRHRQQQQDLDSRLVDAPLHNIKSCCCSTSVLCFCVSLLVSM